VGRGGRSSLALAGNPSSDGVTIKILGSLALTGWRQEGHPVIKNMLQKTHVSEISTFIPHRLSRGLTRGAPAVSSLARGEKCVTAAGVGSTTSQQPCKIAGEVNGLRLKVGTVNVGTMRGRSGEIAEMAERRRLDFCCVQESRWKGGSAKTIGYDDGWYKFFWDGCEEGVAVWVYWLLNSGSTVWWR